MTDPKILCSISTKGRYDTFLPLALTAIMTQTVKPTMLVVYDDNDPPEDVRPSPVYQTLLRMLDHIGINWRWTFADKKGQHHNHQAANLYAATHGYDYVWRVDDDNIPEENVLETLLKAIHGNPTVGAVAGSVLTPDWDTSPRRATGKLSNIDDEPNLQWGRIVKEREVEHLHCTFLYRPGIYDYNLALSKVAHREETLFTMGLFQRGYKLLLVPNAVTWHAKAAGGIRTEQNGALYMHDEHIFQNFLQHRDSTIVILDSGRGDHIVARRVLQDVKNPLVFSCYPDIVPGRSIAEARQMFGDIDHWNIYGKMAQWKWTESLELAYRKLYQC